MGTVVVDVSGAPHPMSCQKPTYTSNRTNSNMIVVEPRGHPLQQLPDLTDRLKAIGAHDDYLKYRNDYLKWRKGSAKGAGGEITVCGEGESADVLAKHVELALEPTDPYADQYKDMEPRPYADKFKSSGGSMTLQWGESKCNQHIGCGCVLDMKAVLAEFITMALFVYIACGTACSNGAGDNAISRLMVAFSFGMSILVLAYSVAHHSGGHINCAVTFALVLSGVTPWRQGLIYTISQLLGSMLGATLLMLTYDCDRDMTGGLGSNVVADGFSYWQVFLAEALMTFMLVYVIFENAVTSKSSSGQNACLVIGFAVFIAHTILLPIDGCSINPTRSFGPAIISALRPCGASENLGLRDLWVMWVGPLFGAAVAALVYIPFSHRHDLDAAPDEERED
eukprot:CAMPEP_0115069988 /NCGR_PEP_ID=MMETSP0227-20121206/12862_1 /TAXON_ID=89957 /ORGANISM="Polarella glacialis, Strain CCMP 1383" /LENGTH=394 /DNA_ID=CAMNT_0002456449 /DNA_START=60 /DNA_END=1244 /DNA_ORIENTATION=-